ncbi:MAG: hypothetical protein HZA20_05180 [Nitrospirae bacterium]|nr:hypothetical protein [Nitrospirota bacterium]
MTTNKTTAAAGKRPPLEWVGALKDLRDKYTSVELQQETTGIMSGDIIVSFFDKDFDRTEPGRKLPSDILR